MKHTLHRLFCLLLCAVLFVGMLPAVTASAATQLGAPSDITWSYTMPGGIFWTVQAPADPIETWFRVDLYKDGKKVYTDKTFAYTGDMAESQYPTYSECSFDDDYTLTTGDYQVAVTAIATREGYSDSETVMSEVWHYTHPGTRYSRPSNITWNYPLISWDSNYSNASYAVKVCFSATKDGTPEEIYFSSITENTTLDLSDYIRYGGKGYYSVKIRTHSWDITQKYHSAWTELSEPYYSNGRYLATPTAKVTTDSATGCPKVTWNKVANAEKYRLYRATSKTGTYEFLKTTKTSSSFLDTTAEPGVTYYYKVRAMGEDPFTGDTCYSAWSNIVSDLCVLAKPAITVSLNEDGDPQITWKTVDGAAKYYIYRSTSKSSGFKHIKSAVSARSYTDTTAEAGTKYYYKIRAIHSNTDANSAYSSVKSITAK